MKQHMIDRITEAQIVGRGWKPGTYLENQVAWLLSSYGMTAEQEHHVGRFRLDFAWADKMIALEADGWYHRSPAGAAKDRNRDSWLRSQGWIIFRVDDEHGELVLREQVARVVRFVRSEDEDWARSYRARKERWPHEPPEG